MNWDDFGDDELIEVLEGRRYTVYSEGNEPDLWDYEDEELIDRLSDDGYMVYSGDGILLSDETERDVSQRMPTVYVVHRDDEGDKLFRHLCDVAEVNYHVTQEELWDALKKKL